MEIELPILPRIISAMSVGKPEASGNMTMKAKVTRQPSTTMNRRLTLSATLPRGIPSTATSST